MTRQIQKIAVIGNAGGGKSTLSRSLAKLHQLPLTHVDSIQFVAGMHVRPAQETIQALNQITAHEKWLIDGFGPLDLIEARFKISDRIVMVDFPIQRHFWWCLKRQIKSLWQKREELPDGCNEATLAHTIKLFRTIWKMHRQMRPELIRILNRPQLQAKVVWIHNLKQWNAVFKKGL